jgi:hypothetical protein
MYVNPGTSYEAVLNDGVTGLVGDLELATLDNVGGTTQAYDTAAIEEIAHGVYSAIRTAPAVAGQYSLVWKLSSTGDIRGVDDLTVTTDVVPGVILGSGDLYITRDQLKSMLDLTSTDFEDTAIDIAIAAACRAIDGYTGHRYYQMTATRYFTANPLEVELFIDDLITATSVTVDQDGDGTYDLTWVEGTDFLLDPANAPLEGRPKRSLLIRQSGGFTYPRGNRWFFESFGQRFPRYERAVKIVGTWGWPAVPPQVTQAAVFIANRFLERTRQAPLGILVASAREITGTARLGRIDPDAAWLLDQIPGGQRRLLI